MRSERLLSRLTHNHPTLMMKCPMLPWLRAAVLSCFAAAAAYADVPSREDSVELQGTESKTIFQGYAVFDKSVRVDGSLWLDGSEKDSSLTIEEGHAMLVAERLHLERHAGVVLNGGRLEVQGGITLGCTVGDYGGSLEMRAGELITSGIMLLNNNENRVAITGGTLIVTGAKAFDYDGLHDMSSVSISGATLRTAGCSWSLNHGAVLTNVVIAAEKGKSITIGAEGAATICRGKLTNSGKLVMAGEVTMALLENKGYIDFRHHALTLTEPTENGGVAEGTGELRLAAGLSRFKTLRAGTLRLSDEGSTLQVNGGDGLTVEHVVLGHLRNTIKADRLGQERIVFHIDGAELTDGIYPLLTLTSESDLSAMTLMLNERMIEVEDDPMALGGTSHLLDMELSADGRSLLLIVTSPSVPEPSSSVFGLLVLTAHAAWRRRA